MMQRLFVYGTLGPGRRNEYVLTAIGGTWQEASVCGSLRPAEWGAQMGYPGIVLDNSDEEVNGYVFVSENLYAHWDDLDAFEGEEYVRVLAQVTTGANATAEAHIYALREG